VLLTGASAAIAAPLAVRIEAIVAERCQGPDGKPLSLVCGHADAGAAPTPAAAVAAADEVLLELKAAAQALAPIRR